MYYIYVYHQHKLTPDFQLKKKNPNQSFRFINHFFHSSLLPSTLKVTINICIQLIFLFYNVYMNCLPGCTHVDLWAGFQASGLCRWGLRSEGTQRWVLSELHKILHGFHWKKDSQTDIYINTVLFWVKVQTQSFRYMVFTALSSY